MLTAFPARTYRQRIDAVKRRLAERGLDALIVNYPDNINYLTGFDSLGFLWYQALIISPKLERPLFITRTSEEPCTWELSCIEEAVFYDIARQDPLRIVADILEDHGLGQARIGLEMQASTFSALQYTTLLGHLPQARFEDASVVVAEERLIKTAEEIEYQRSAARMADHGMRAAFAALRPGISEVQVAGIVAQALGEAGSEYSAISPMCATGRRSTMTHAMPHRQTISPGDVVILEHAGVCNRYHAILMRTAVIGTPSPRVREVATLLTEAFNAAVDVARPGTPVGEANTVCNAILDRIDLSRTRVHRIGYSLGLAYPPTWLEAMMVDEADDHVFQPNMSFSIEPNLSLYSEGFGIKLGDTVLCAADGSHSLSELAPELVVID
ncbi:M24 family metallopeptidase [Phytopseudomonas dryadis]|uniref:Aminopeptidase P family protein n=1 Tax=Phytopseudomonas dryadis TaxID=2487520 RepID=A0A4Q9QTN5_9GAMM|nr:MULTISPECIES: Xaa-Pro peptidase family protein [Pseudomonas]TBU86247.1 aminopeptidase P family protein [Pseudomonas dryadis]TBV07683.1 aminopeptidase P family protein [Pseudomonas dryadis]TBV19889.1 aminopeptidase P family protein [Pseudomonas sp. FRB 230]